MREEDVSWSNIHITNELREGLLVEVFIQHPGQPSTPKRQREGGRERETHSGKRERKKKKTHVLKVRTQLGSSVRRPD